MEQISIYHLGLKLQLPPGSCQQASYRKASCIAMQTHLSREGWLPCFLTATVGVIMTAAQPQSEA